MAKKERRRAHRQTQRKREAAKQGKPTLRRSVIMGAVLGLAYFLLMEYVVGDEDRSVWVNALWSGIFFVFYSVFIYYWESFLHRRRLRKKEREG